MIGKKPLEIPKEVSLSTEQMGEHSEFSVVKVKGPKGELAVNILSQIKVIVGENEVALEKREGASQAIFGLSYALLRNAVEGVSRGFRKELELVGVGYRATKTADGLKFTLGFSHPVEFKLPEGVSADLDGDTKIMLSGIDKQLVSQTAAEIRKLRPPEPYKGKGIRYSDEVVRRKLGKAAKTAQSTTL